MTRLEIKLNSITKEIEKLEVSIERNRAKLAKTLVKLAKAGFTPEQLDNNEEWHKIRVTLDDKQKDVVWDYFDHSGSVKDVESRYVNASRRLAKVEKEVEAVEAKKDNYDEIIRQNRVEVIEQYLDNWLVEVLAFYDRKGELDAGLEKDLKWERNRKRDFIVWKVFTTVGKITDATHIYLGNDGNINGKIIGVNGSCFVTTIMAGGYNIQRLHYRVLIDKIK